MKQGYWPIWPRLGVASDIGNRHLAPMPNRSPLDDPRNGAVSVWVDRASAEAFAAVDPFVLHGVVRRWHLIPWPESE